MSKQYDATMHSAGEFIGYAEAWLQKQKRLAQLEIAEKGSLLFSGLATTAILGTVALLAVIFLSLAAGFWLAALWGSFPLAFGVVGVAYLIILFLVYLLRRPLITRPSLTFLLKILIHEEEQDA